MKASRSIVKFRTPKRIVNGVRLIAEVKSRSNPKHKHTVLFIDGKFAGKRKRTVVCPCNDFHYRKSARLNSCFHSRLAKKVRAASMLLVALFIFASAAQAQLIPQQSTSPEHAIQPEQCRADVRLWFSQGKGVTDALSVHDLELRAAEMWNCVSVDTGNGEGFQDYKRDSDHYLLLYSAFDAFAGRRALNYIKRHREANTFLAEDTAGERRDEWPNEPVPSGALYDSGNNFLSWCDAASDFEKSMLPEEREAIGNICTEWVQGVMTGMVVEDDDRPFRVKVNTQKSSNGLYDTTMKDELGNTITYPSEDLCVPDNTSPNARKQVVIDYIKGHPTKLSMSADFLAVAALKTAYSCKAHKVRQ
jgi:Rap1a immunity proteins